MFTYLKCFPDVDLPFRRYMVSALHQGNHHLETVSMTRPIRHRFAPTLSFRMVNFVARLPSIVGFSGEIITYQKTFCVITLRAQQKRENKQKKNPESAWHYMEGFFAVITLLTLSNLIEILVAMRSSF